MQLSLRTFSQLLQDMSAAVQGSATRLLDLSVGSVLRSILEANASIALWMQWLIVEVLQTIRAATSVGLDLDSWMLDFMISRLPATKAVGIVTFSRYVTGLRSLIRPGTRVKTRNGEVSFLVVANPSSPTWSTDDNAYLVLEGQDRIDIPVEAEPLGVAGNVQAGTISVIASSIPGIDEVSNQAPTVGGSDAETDARLRERFKEYINSRSRATKDAVAYAIASIQQGINFVIHENIDFSGHDRLGHFVITVDDGTGYPPDILLSAVRAAVEAVRPVGTTFSIHPPTVIVVDVMLNAKIGAGVQVDVVKTLTTDAIQTYIDRLPIGAELSLTRIAQIAYSAHVAVENVSNVTVDDLQVDFVPEGRSVVKSGVIAVI